MPTVYEAFVTRLVISGVLFFISVSFVLRAVLVARLVKADILLSTSDAFLFRSALARLVISGFFISIYGFCIERSSGH